LCQQRQGGVETKTAEVNRCRSLGGGHEWRKDKSFSKFNSTLFGDK